MEAYYCFVSATKGGEEHRDPIEIAKNTRAEKLFAKLNDNSMKYGAANSYRQLMNIMSE